MTTINIICVHEERAIFQGKINVASFIYSWKWKNALLNVNILYALKIERLYTVYTRRWTRCIHEKHRSEKYKTRNYGYYTFVVLWLRAVGERFHEQYFVFFCDCSAAKKSVYENLK